MLFSLCSQLVIPIPFDNVISTNCHSLLWRTKSVKVTGTCSILASAVKSVLMQFLMLLLFHVSSSLLQKVYVSDRY